MGETFEVGDEVICTDAYHIVATELKYNSRYIVTELVGINYVKVYSVDEQQGLPGVFNVNRFKLIKPAGAAQRILLEPDMSAMNKELKEELDRSDRGARDNTGKPKLSFCLLGMETIEGEARVWEAGAKKYTRGNWLKGREYTECADSLLRHMTKFLNGHDIDEETGCYHVDMIHTSAKILAQAFHTRKDLDDRHMLKETTHEQI